MCRASPSFSSSSVDDTTLYKADRSNQTEEKIQSATGSSQKLVEQKCGVVFRQILNELCDKDTRSAKYVDVQIQGSAYVKRRFNVTAIH